jgi:hypothetical protein
MGVVVTASSTGGIDILSNSFVKEEHVSLQEYTERLIKLLDDPDFWS